MGSFRPGIENPPQIADFTTDSGGSLTGTTFIVSNAGATNNFYKGMTAIITASTTSALVNEEREIIGYDSATGTFTVEPGFTAQVPTSTSVRVQDDRPGAASVSGGIVALSGAASGAGTTATLVDTVNLTHTDDYWNGMMLIMRSGNNQGLSRRIKDFTNATGTITVEEAFPNATAAGDLYSIYAMDFRVAPANDVDNATFVEAIGNKTDNAVQASGTTASALAYLKGLLTSIGNPAAHTLTSLTAKLGNLSLALATILQYSFTKAATGATDYFSTEANIIVLAPAGPSELSGVAISLNAFTATATITLRVYKTINGTERLFLETTRIVGTDPDGFNVLSAPDIIDGTGALNSWRLTARSNNAGDIAVAVPYQYGLRRNS